MSQAAQIVPVDRRRLVLGFDAGCMTCSGIAQQIEETANSKIEIASLRDPEVTQWRRTALGKNAPWAPTLIEVNGLSVRAWTGWRMGLRLGRYLGPRTTWRVMQALGEVATDHALEASSAVEQLPEKAVDLVVGMSRSRFLKGAGGAAVAMSLMSGIGPMANLAKAAEPTWHYPPSLRFTRFSGQTLRDRCNAIAKRTSCEWVAGPEGATYLRGAFRVSSTSNQLVTGSGGTQGRGGVHVIRGGNRLFVYTFVLPNDKLITVYEWERKRNGIKYEIKRWNLNSTGDRMLADRAVFNGTRCLDANRTVQSKVSCPGCKLTSSSTFFQQSCSNTNYGCVASKSATGIAGCVGARRECKNARGRGKIVCLASFYLCAEAIMQDCCNTVCNICVQCQTQG